MDTLGKRLKEARLAHQPKKLTQKEVAVQAGISQTTVADIERGRNDGSKYLAELASALNCSLTWLATSKGEMFGTDVPAHPNQKDGGPTLTPEQQQILLIMNSISPEARQALLKAVALLTKSHKSVVTDLPKPQSAHGVNDRAAPVESERIETPTYIGADRRRKHFGIPEMRRRKADITDAELERGKK